MNATEIFQQTLVIRIVPQQLTSRLDQPVDLLVTQIEAGRDIIEEPSFLGKLDVI